MALRKRKRGFLMTILVVVLFTLMIAELFVFVMLNISYNKIQQSASSVSQSINYASALKSIASSFAQESLSRALSTLTKYEYNASLRKDNFVSNLSLYLSDLIINGTLPNVPRNSIAANIIASYMGNSTFLSYNLSIINNLKPSPISVGITESNPIIYQNGPYNLSIYFLENASVSTPSGVYNYSIPVYASIPLNGTLDLFYAQQGIQKEIRFSSVSNLSSVIGNAYATYGNSSQNAFIYGIVLHVPSGVTCTSLSSNLPTWAQSAPLNKSVILATPSAVDITNGTCNAANRFGGLVTYSINSISSPPNIPWLVYSSSTNILNQIPNGAKVLLYGPGMDLLDISRLRSAIQNGFYFASPFLPSYSERVSGNFGDISPNGIFTFENGNRQVANFNGQNSYVTISNNINVGQYSVTVSAWIMPASSKNVNGPRETIVSSKENQNGGFVLAINNNNNMEGDFWVNIGGSWYGPVTAPHAFSQTNKWYFIASTYNGNYISIYVNGNKVNQSAVTGSINQPSGPTNIGSRNDNSNNFFNGSIANVQIYNTSLSGQQIQYLYQEGIAGLPISNAGLVGWWPLNGNANDYSGFGDNGTPVSVSYSSPLNYTRDSIYVAPTPATYPIPGTLSCISGTNCKSALYISKLPLEISQNFDVAGFSGTSYIIQNNGFGFMNNAIQPATISIWVNPSSPNGDIVDELGQSSINTNWHDTWIDLVNGNVNIRVWGLGCVNLGPIPLNSWSNIVMSLSYNGVSLNYSGYINGVYKGSGTGSRSTPGGTSLMYYPLGSSDYTNCGDGGAYFQGEMANYQFYNTTLSRQQIYSIYKNGLAGAPIDLQNLVLWYPLLGNANDYSGNGNNATAYNIYYSPISGSYPNAGMGISGIINEKSEFGLNG
jgi:hypothetical protein